jgi:hypothetical protein
LDKGELTMGCGSNNSAANQLRQQQQAQQQYTNQAVGQINQAFAGYTPQFFQGVGQNYMNWALPQLNNQYQQTANQLGAKLANQGVTNSSGAMNAYNQLQQTNQLNQQGIASSAQQQANQLQQQVGNEQAGLVAQALQSTNPQQVAQQALGAASQFSAPSSFQPLGNLFGTFGQLYLANNLANTYNPATQNLLGLMGNNYYGFGGGY